MGMFDSVMVSCPRCSEMHELQSKVGECILSTFGIDAVPAVIADDIEGKVVWCDCGARFSLVAPRKPDVVRMKILLE